MHKKADEEASSAAFGEGFLVQIKGNGMCAYLIPLYMLLSLYVVIIDQFHLNK